MFIHEQFISDISLCDKLIQYHKENSYNYTPSFDPEEKDSVDIELKKTEQLMSQYFMQLMPVVKKYVEIYPHAGGNSQWAIFEPVGIQYYKVGGGYKKWHTERHSGEEIINKRHLVFMTYLNDVPDGGTEFYYQNLTTKAIKGKTIIWPADWTYTHRGQISKTKEKYVITGWFSFK